MAGNLQKARKKWVRLLRILGREGENARVSGNLFKAAAQAIIIFGSKTWVMTPHKGWIPGGFQHRVDLRLMGKQPQRLQYRSWKYPPSEKAMRGEGLEEVGEYVLRRQNTVALYITMRKILDLCEEAVRRPGLLES